MGHFITPVFCGWWFVCTTWFVQQVGDMRLPQNAHIQHKRCLYYALNEIEVECILGIEWRHQWEYPRHRHQKKQQGECDETENIKQICYVNRYNLFIWFSITLISAYDVFGHMKSSFQSLSVLWWTRRKMNWRQWLERRECKISIVPGILYITEDITIILYLQS